MRLISVFTAVVLALPLLASAAPSQDQKDFAAFLVSSQEWKGAKGEGRHLDDGKELVRWSH